MNGNELKEPAFDDDSLPSITFLTLLTLSFSIRTTFPSRCPTTVDSMVHLLQEYYHTAPSPVKPSPGKTNRATFKAAPYKSIRLVEMNAGYIHPTTTPSPGPPLPAT
jgi:hypothetical protein